MRWRSLLFALVALLPYTGFGQVLHPQDYPIGSPTWRDIWVDPVNGLDSRTGLTRGQAVRTVTEAWGRVPSGSPLSTAYRIRLVAGTHSVAPNFWEERRGTASFPVLIEAADGPGTAVLGAMNIANCSYLYFSGLRVTEGGGDVFHLQFCDHVLLRQMQIVGTGTLGNFNAPQEALKVNQSQHIYLEDCDISGAWDNAADFVAVQYGHVLRSSFHRAGDWAMYMKGGSAYFTVEGCTFYDAGTGGFTAGQGTGFEFMSSPWLHYEAYDIKFINNVIHHTSTVGVGVNGGYNILIAYNTLYRSGTNDHVIEVVHGRRGCDGDGLQCQANRSAGGWGSSGGEEQYIPSKNVFIYNNIIYNPAGARSRWNQITVAGPVSPPAGTGVANPSSVDQNLRIRGNLIWNGPPDEPNLPILDGGGCAPGHPSCAETTIRAANTINVIQPALVQPEQNDFRPIAQGNVFGIVSENIPAFPGNDRPTSPVSPPGNLVNSVVKDRGGVPRNAGGPPGAWSGPANTPPTVSVSSPSNGTLIEAGGTITLEAVASDTDGISNVTYYAEGRSLGTATVAPYSVVWSNVSRRLHRIVAVATDTRGASMTATLVRLVARGTNRAVACDFDGDRRSDPSLYWPAGGAWYLAQSVGGPRVVNWGWSEALPATGDYDGDGRADIAVHHRASGNWFILESDGGLGQTVGWGWSQALPVPEDYDGDGVTDVAVYHPASGNWYILLSRDGSFVFRNWGWNEARPVPRDYDGDGKADLAVHHAPSGRWIIFQTASQTTRMVGWGWSESRPVPSCFDSDLLSDIAVYHAVSGQWYQLLSQGGSRIQGWGWIEALPVAADYDGDGKDDLSVYHPTSGLWSISRSGSNGQLQTLQWGWSAAMPVLPQTQWLLQWPGP